MQPPTQFLLPENQLVEQLFDADSPYTIHSDAPRRQTITLLDTFDWRLHKMGWHLELRGKTLTLFMPDDTTFNQKITTAPPFRIEKPDTGAVTEKLAPVIQMRALLAMGTCTETIIAHRMLDDEQKTVVRLTEFHILPTCATPRPATQHIIKISPLKGYEKIANQIAKTVQSQGAVPLDTPWWETVMRACGNPPGGYSSKINVPLSPDMPATVAVKMLLQHLLATMTTNLPYIAQDIDTEFLHDFRVAVRRTRAALSQLKDVLPAEDVARFKQDFSFVGKLTNRLRDLDVYLLAEPEYRRLLPNALRDGISPLFAYLHAERATALKQVSQSLNSARVKQILSDWDDFLQSPPDADTTAHMTIGELARRRIYRRYKRLIKDGNRLLCSTDEAALHRLRIDAKKLRYLLEFFASLFPPKEMKSLIKQLKRLQDNLGDFNDLSVQSDFLLDVALHAPPKKPWANETVLAIGCLLGISETKKEVEKSRFAKTFTTFAAPKNRARFKKLFAMPKDGTV